MFFFFGKENITKMTKKVKKINFNGKRRKKGVMVPYKSSSRSSEDGFETNI